MKWEIERKGITTPVVLNKSSIGYTFPWMDWYRDFISGSVPNSSGSPAYIGIGPEALLKCTVRETATNSCK